MMIETFRTIYGKQRMQVRSDRYRENAVSWIIGQLFADPASSSRTISTKLDIDGNLTIIGLPDRSIEYHIYEMKVPLVRKSTKVEWCWFPREPD